MQSEQQPKLDVTTPVNCGADVFVQMLNANDVDFLFINSGTDTFPIQESIAKFNAEGYRTPKVVLCPDESTALAAAHGHFMVSRKPQVVLVHVDAGTGQIAGGMHNAQRGRAGIVVCAGRAPMTFDGEMAGTRSMGIHWTQEQLDQPGILRNFTKWDYEIRRSENIEYVMQRAFQLTSSEPSGPVYLMLPREVLMEPVVAAKIPSINRHAALTTPQADLKGLKQAAKWLVKAQSPLIIAGHSGRNIDSVDLLVELVDLTGAQVVSDGMYMNFPTDNPAYVGPSADPYVGQADVILSIDQEVPYIPAQARPKPDAKIINIDIDPVKPSIPLWVFPTDLLLHADSAKALRVLNGLVKEFITDGDQAKIEERTSIIADRFDARRKDVDKIAESQASNPSITPQWLSYCINRVIDPDIILLDESVTNSANVVEYVQRIKPGTQYRSGGSSLGWGLGAALGAKLSSPEKTVIVTVGDGAFIYGCPVSTLWAADVYDAPFLAVIYNNQMHNAPKQSLKSGYPDSYSDKFNNWVGMELGPSVDFSMLAASCRAYGETVSDPSQVEVVLERALEEVRKGRAAVVDVRIERPQ